MHANPTFLFHRHSEHPISIPHSLKLKNENSFVYVVVAPTPHYDQERAPPEVFSLPGGGYEHLFVAGLGFPVLKLSYTSAIILFLDYFVFN